MFSGVTDCYQPIEASYRLTRGCLQVCAEVGNPVGIITKAPLIERDLDILQELARVAGVRVILSVPFWDDEKARAVEPYVATPARRMRTVRRLADAGIPVGVNVAPIIPGLNDEEIPRVLTAARDRRGHQRGVRAAAAAGPVAQVFEERMRAAMPLRVERICTASARPAAARSMTRAFGTRGRGEGPYAAAIQRLFTATAARLGLRTNH